MLGLRFCARAFSSCGERGPLFIAVCGPLTVVASLVAEHSSRRAGSVVVAHGPSCSVACGILPDQGSNPCPLHWQADSQPLRHQGSPPQGLSTSQCQEADTLDTECDGVWAMMYIVQWFIMPTISTFKKYTSQVEEGSSWSHTRMYKTSWDLLCWSNFDMPHVSTKTKEQEVHQGAFQTIYIFFS